MWRDRRTQVRKPQVRSTNFESNTSSLGLFLYPIPGRYSESIAQQISTACRQTSPIISREGEIMGIDRVGSPLYI